MNNFYRSFLFALILLLSITEIFGQCLLKERSIQYRSDRSLLVIEGEVFKGEPFLDEKSQLIHTKWKVRVTKRFKGALWWHELNIVTLGGKIGNTIHAFMPSLELREGDKGIFFLHPHKDLKKQFNTYVPFTGPQGFVKYNAHDFGASDPFNSFDDREDVIYELATLQGIPYEKEDHSQQQQAKANKKSPSISGISPSSLNAGVSDQLTISGSGFGASQGSSTVSFANSNSGGTTKMEPVASQYISWTDNQIVLEVPARAGTGKVSVNVNGETAESSSDLNVGYAIANFTSGSDRLRADLADIDGQGGITFNIHTDLHNNADAKATIESALNTWVCKTGVNLKVGPSTSVDTVAKDGTNVIRYADDGELPSNVLGRTFFNLSGCSNGLKTEFRMTEADIIIDSTATWNFTSASPTGNEVDFHSVVFHELGHAFMLGHVIDDNNVMHWTIGKGIERRETGVQGEMAGKFMHDESIMNNVCGGPPMTTATNCQTLEPEAAFVANDTVICAGDMVSFTDMSTNAPDSWAWTFAGADSATSSVQNPTGITYSSAGSYDVTLIATNKDGNDTITLPNYITVTAAPVAAATSDTNTVSLLDAGKVNFNSDNSTGNSLAFAWDFDGDGNTDATAQNPSHTYTQVGSYNAVLTVTDNNNCTSTDTMEITVNSGSTGINDYHGLPNLFSPLPQPGIRKYVQCCLKNEGSSADQY